MKRNTSFAREIISKYEGTPQVQKIELKRQKKNFHISQEINEYNLKKARQRSLNNNNSTIHNSSSNILNTSNYNSNQNNTNKTTRTKPSISSIPIQKYKPKGPDTQVISTGENIPLNLFEISSNENNKALLIKFIKYNNETDIDNILFKLGTIRLNLFSQYVSTCLSVLSDYQTLLNQPIIKSIQKYENGIIIEKQLLNMKKYIHNYIKKLPDNKKNKQINEYLKFLEKEIDLGKKLGIDSDSYEINYLFNFFPKGIEIIFDYEVFESVYYNSKKNNKISGKALLPSPEFCFKLDPYKIGVKFFDFEIEIEDIEDMKQILSQIWKIIQDKLKIAKLFIEPCLAQARLDLEKNEKEKENKKNIDNKYPLVENIKNKNNININSLNTKTNTTEMTLTNNINEINTIKKNMNIIGKKNYTYTTTNVNNNIIKNIENNFDFNKTKNSYINKNINTNNNNNNKQISQITKEDNESEDKKTDINQNEVNDAKNILNDLDDEKSQLTENKNDFFKDENFGNINISEDINKKKV